MGARRPRASAVDGRGGLRSPEHRHLAPDRGVAERRCPQGLRRRGGHRVRVPRPCTRPWTRPTTSRPSRRLSNTMQNVRDGAISNGGLSASDLAQYGVTAGPSTSPSAVSGAVAASAAAGWRGSGPLGFGSVTLAAGFKIRHVLVRVVLDVGHLVRVRARRDVMCGVAPGHRADRRAPGRRGRSVGSRDRSRSRADDHRHRAGRAARRPAIRRALP